ncbi:MAG: MBL fold metallo-hydrolase [Candidatus Berkelbacteria bacterium]
MTKISIEDLQKIESREHESYTQNRATACNNPHKIKGNFISFFGRQYKPFFRNDQGFRPLFCGFYIKFDGTELLVDPGANILDRSQASGVNLYRLNSVFISHSHIDHDNDANVAMELASCSHQNVKLLASEQTLANGSVKPYHISENPKLVLKVETLSDQEIKLSEKVSLKPIKVFHSIDGTYGFVMDIDGLRVGYTSDTGFTKKFKTSIGEYEIGETDYQGTLVGPTKFDDKLKDIFSNVDVLIFNLHGFAYNKHSLFHSVAFDLIEILKDSKVKLCVCDHLSPGGAISKNLSAKIIHFIEQQTDKKIVLVGSNGLTLDLDKLVSMARKR